MHVKGSTTYRFFVGWARHESLCSGALLVVALLAVLAAPCARGLGGRPADILPLQAQTAPADPQLPPVEAPAHCALHCELLIRSLLMLVVAPTLAACVPLIAPTLRLRLTSPPLLPPPQPA